MGLAESATTFAERIGEFPITPSMLGFDHRCLTILRCSLSAAEPDEGCALLIGSQSHSGVWQLEQVWPCCNVWLPRSARGQRFTLDPREQLAAQRWARERGQQVLGVAHSHPNSSADASPRDRQWGIPGTLALILAGDGDLKGWWLAADRRAQEVPLEVWDTRCGDRLTEAP